MARKIEIVELLKVGAKTPGEIITLERLEQIVKNFNPSLPPQVEFGSYGTIGIVTQIWIEDNILKGQICLEANFCKQLDCRQIKLVNVQFYSHFCGFKEWALYKVVYRGITEWDAENKELKR